MVSKIELISSSSVPSEEEIQRALKEQGAIILHSTNKPITFFEELSETLMSKCMVHHGVATGQRDSQSVSNKTATVDKGLTAIPLHREYAYALGAPDVMMFYCRNPAISGGETTLCDGVELFSVLPLEIQEELRHMTLEWQWSVPPVFWQTALGVSSIKEALAKLEEIKSYSYNWEAQTVTFEEENLKGLYTVPVILKTRWKEEEAFCNYLPNFYLREVDEYYKKPPIDLYTNGKEGFPQNLLKEIMRYADAVTFSVPWRKGDIAIIDNTRYMHGRNIFSDKDRSILVRMGQVNF